MDVIKSGNLGRIVQKMDTLFEPGLPESQATSGWTPFKVVETEM